MKIGLWAALSATLTLAACAQPALPPRTATDFPQPAPQVSRDKQRLQLSQQRWQQMRDSVPAYSYQVVFESHTGFRNVTTVRVRQHRVVERRLETQARRDIGLSVQWVETGAALGTHAGAAPALTLDELYSRAREVLERPLRPHEQRSLGIDERGLLQHCLVRDRHVSDDAPQNGVPHLKLELN